MSEFVYDAFISYSHRDMAWAKWLQHRLETFHVPREIAGERMGRRRLRVFRDQTDLAGAELQASLNRELEKSRFLVVICSPASAASRWVDEEIRTFRRLGRRDRIIPFIVSGEPMSDQPELECFPPCLRTGEEEDDPLGVNIQEIGRGKAFLKLVSVLLEVRFNRLVDREKQRRRRTLLVICALCTVTLAVTGTLLASNISISRSNRRMKFDIYGAALVALARKESMEQEEVEFLEDSAEEGNVEAILMLADCYLRGWGVGVDPEKAFMWYGRAAEAGNPQGMIGLANCYLSGVGTQEDPEKVFEWNLKAARAGDPAGMVNVAACYEDGYGTAPGGRDALRWYQKAARRRYDLGMFHLARCCTQGIGMPPNNYAAFLWMRELARDGNLDAMYNVGLMYQYGYGTGEDPREAYGWYRKAADAGSPEAMRMTGWCVEHGYGIDSVPLEWYLRAAQAGDAEALGEVERLMGTATAQEAARAIEETP